MECYREVKRCLRNDGTCWIVIGDSYASSQVDIFPETKLSSVENKDMGMGIDCIFRELKENPFSTNDKDKIKPRYFKYSIGGRISRITLPLPPTSLWNEYMMMRNDFKERVDNMASEQLERMSNKENIEMLSKENRKDYRLKKLSAPVC